MAGRSESTSGSDFFGGAHRQQLPSIEVQLASLDTYLRHSLAADGALACADELAVFHTFAEFVRQRPQLQRGGIAALSIEASIVVAHHNCSSRRYIVGVPVAALGRDPWQDLRALATAMAAPTAVAACIETLAAQREVPTAVHFGYAVTADGKPARRFYVERRPLQALLGAVSDPFSLAMLGCQWFTANGEVQWRRYDEAARCAVQANPELAASLTALAGGAGLGHLWRRSDVGVGPVATDDYCHFCGIAIADAVDAIADVAQVWCEQRQRCGQLLARAPAGAQLRALGVGVDGHGQRRFKVYHGPGDAAQALASRVGDLGHGGAG